METTCWTAERCRPTENFPDLQYWSRETPLHLLSILPSTTNPTSPPHSRLNTREMQPFGRSLARAVWGKARVGVRETLPQSASIRDQRLRPFQQPATCLQCRIRAIGPSLRYYSTQPPPKDPSQPPTTPSAEPEASSYDEKSSPSTAEALSDLPSAQEDRRSQINEKFSRVMDNLQSRVLTASQTLNQVTGYTSIESIKLENDALELSLSDAHERVRAARQAYKTSNARRAATQREVTTLLARKESWTPSDLERFTELYRTDHVLEGEVTTAQETLTESEAEEQSLSQRLNAGILKRYHEEQIWSDRIRRASTWGTWGLMGMNFLTFLIFQFVAEPWRRKRLVKGVAEEEKEVLNELRSELEAIKGSLLQTRGVVADAPDVLDVSSEVSVAEAASVADPSTISIEEPVVVQEPVTLKPAPLRSWKEFLSDPVMWRSAIRDLWSDRRFDLRMVDASILVLEGALAGAVVAGSVAWSIARK